LRLRDIHSGIFIIICASCEFVVPRPCQFMAPLVGEMRWRNWDPMPVVVKLDSDKYPRISSVLNG
jgi:hypothetical protein